MHTKGISSNYNKKMGKAKQTNKEVNITEWIAFIGAGYAYSHLSPTALAQFPMMRYKKTEPAGSAFANILPK